MATPFKNAAVAEARAALDRAYKVTELAAAGDRELTVARLEMTRARNVLQSATEQLNAAQQKHREASVNFQNADSKLRIARSNYKDGDYEKARDAEDEARIVLDKLKNSA